MNTPDANDPLSRTLAAWRVTPPPDPNFRPAVWQRLARRTRETWAAYLRAHLIGWAAVAGLAIVAAGWAGRAVARAKLDAARDQMVVSYLGAIDPRVMAKLRP